jgi:serine/threonine protein kinase
LAAVKVGIDVSRDVELVREAAMLTAARHPGVVGLLGLSDGPDGLELVTAWVGTRSLANTRPLAPAEGAGVVGALAATVADLHRHGIVHGAIDASHVLLDDRGRPVLCSFAHAVLINSSATMDGPRPSDDVAALGELLVDVVGPHDDPEIVPVRRFARRQEHHLHRSILTVADHARAHDRASRPSAASLAAALADLAPGASLPADVAGARPPVSPDPVTAGLDEALDRLRSTIMPVPVRRRRWPFVASVVSVALLAIGIIGTLAGRTPSRAKTGDLAPTPIATGSPTSTRVMTTRTTTAAPAPAPVVALADGRYEVGAPGDQASVAAWRCDGRPRVVLLRPATGELFLFDNAPQPGADTVATPFTAIEGASGLAPVDGDDPCPALVVLRADRSAVPVDLPVDR